VLALPGNLSGGRRKEAGTALNVQSPVADGRVAAEDVVALPPIMQRSSSVIRVPLSGFERRDDLKAGTILRSLRILGDPPLEFTDHTLKVSVERPQLRDLRLNLSNVARDEFQDVVTGDSTLVSERKDAPNVR